MHSDGFDLLTISLARAGGLPLYPLVDRMTDYERQRRLRELGPTPTQAAIRETERRQRNASRRLLARITGRLLRTIGERLSRYGSRLSGPASGQLQGCG